MTPRDINYRKRRDSVLGIVVGQYIQTVTPVSSGFIAKNYDLDLSSATIRNILAELEELGYLTHPHTSAGRVPTQTGYRYYVDHLMKEIHILEAEKKRIEAEYKRDVAELETLLARTSEMISNLTQYTSIISLDGDSEKFYCRGTSYVVGYPEMQDVNKIRNILQALEEKERILEILSRSLQKKIEIYIGAEIKCEEIEGCSLAVSSFKRKDGLSGRIAVLGPTWMDYERVVSTLDYISGLVENT